MQANQEKPKMSEEDIKILQEGENGIPLKRKTDYTKFKRHGVYNRKFARNWLKKQMGTNKIKNAWHQLKREGKIGGTCI